MGEGAGFVKYDVGDFGHFAQGMAILEVETHPPKVAHRTAKGKRKTQSQGTGTGNNQNGAQRIPRHCRVNTKPINCGDRCDEQYHVGEATAHPVGKSFEAMHFLLPGLVVPQAGEVALVYGFERFEGE